MKEVKLTQSSIYYQDLSSLSKLDNKKLKIDCIVFYETYEGKFGYDKDIEVPDDQQVGWLSDHIRHYFDLHYKKSLSQCLPNTVLINEPNEGTATYNDCHFWLQDANGKIIDPTPSAKKGKLHYKQFGTKKSKEIYKVWNERLKHFGKKTIREDFLEPVDRCCQFNVYARWYNNKKLKVCIGSLGFERPNGKIFWEFG